MKKAFTLIELVVAIALLGMVLSFSGVIFKVSIDSHRTSGANTDIMQKLRAITDQLNADFKELPKDGYLLLHGEVQNRREYEDSILPSNFRNFRADRIYYFCTGDFQSWYDRSVRSDIARVYLGHDYISLDAARDEPVSRWNLARDLLLLTPGIALPLPIDCNGISYAACKANPLGISANAGILLGPPPTGLPPRIDIRNDANDVRRLMCEDAGEILIEWADGTRYPTTHPNPVLRNSLVWFGYSTPRKDGAPIDGIVGDPAYDGTVEVEGSGPPRFYRAFWTPLTPKRLWPKALKFTFTLYDSKGILEKGRTFTHIVYLDN